MIVVGADLSTFAIDLVRLDYDSDRAEWHRIALGGDKTPKLDRIRNIGHRMPRGQWWDDVSLVGIEQPAGKFGVADVAAAYGAVLARIPERVAVFQFRPAEWRKACGLPGNCNKETVAVWALSRWDRDLPANPSIGDLCVPYDVTDAYAIAYAARNINASAASVAEGNQTQEIIRHALREASQ